MGDAADDMERKCIDAEFAPQCPEHGVPMDKWGCPVCEMHLESEFCATESERREERKWNIQTGACENE